MSSRLRELYIQLNMLLDKSSIFITLALIIAVLCNARAIDHDLFDIQLE